MKAGDLYYLARKLQAHAEEALGASPGQVDAVPFHHRLILGYVIESPGAVIGEIARRLSLAQSVVSTAVAALRDEGLVVTDADPDDRRRTKVAPSDRLERWAEKYLRADAREVMAPVLDSLPARERSSVLRGLSLLHQAFRRQEEARPSLQAPPRSVV